MIAMMYNYCMGEQRVNIARPIASPLQAGRRKVAILEGLEPLVKLFL